ncbi:glycogen synthase, partial [Striga asiatica]
MPRLSTPITQDECLYDGRWIKQADNVFVDLLIESHMLGQWTNGRPGGVVFDYCCGFLIGELDLIYSHDELEARFDFLQKRYQAFSWMLGKPGLRHCVQSNILTALVAVWDEIFETILALLINITVTPAGKTCVSCSRRCILQTQLLKLFMTATLQTKVFFALPAARTNVVSDNSYHNALQTLCSRNNAHPQHGGPYDATSASS